MEQVTASPLCLVWDPEETKAALSRLLPPVRDDRVEVDIVHAGSVALMTRRRRNGGGIAPSCREVWELWLVGGSDRAVRLLVGVESNMHLLRHVSVSCEEKPSLLGAEVTVRVVVPKSMQDPSDPPPEFLIHVEEGR